MKKIHIKYNIMVPEDRFSKACRKAMVGRDEMVREIKDRAQTFGRVSVEEFIDGFSIK